jgi:hypothetical protein
VVKIATFAKPENVGGNGAKTYPTENKKQKKRNYFENDNTALNIIF